MAYIYLCTLLCVYILSLLSTLGALYISFIKALYHRHSMLTIQLSHMMYNESENVLQEGFLLNL